MKKKRLVPFGLHLMVDGYECSHEVLDNFHVSYDFLNKLPNLLGMKLLTHPYVIHAQDNGIKDPGGWTGFVVIQESHISVHTFPKRGFVTIDVYSCTQFDAKKALNYIRKLFKTQNLEYYIQIRGQNYPERNIH